MCQHWWFSAAALVQVVSVLVCLEAVSKICRAGAKLFYGWQPVLLAAASTADVYGTAQNGKASPMVGGLSQHTVT